MTQNKKALIILNISRPIRNIIKRFALVILVVLAIVTVFVSCGNNHLFKRSTVTDFFLAPITKTSDFFNKINESIANFSNLGKIKEVNEKLKIENKKLKSKLLDVKGIIVENEKLKRILSFTDQLGYNFITTQIIGNFSSPFISSILINSGENSGVKEGQAVINQDGLIGRISDVGKYSSRVLLITDIDSQIPVKALTTGEKAIMSGVNNSVPVLKYISLDASFTEKEIIVTSGEGEVYPPNIKIGTILKQNKTEQVIPFVNMNDLDYVSIIEYNKPIDDIIPQEELPQLEEENGSGENVEQN